MFACKLSIAFVVAICLSAAYSQESATAAAATQNTLHSTSRLVVLDIVVKDAADRSVENLSAEDFTVFEDGVPQKISSFEPPSVHRFTAAQNADSSSGTALIKNADNSSLTIFVLDEFNSSFEESSYARKKLHQFLESHPHLHQPASLMRMTQFGISVVADYTCDGNVLRTVLEHLPVQSVEMLLKGRTARLLDRTDTTLAAFNQIALASRDHKGRKNVIWIGSGFPSKLHITGHPRLLETIRDTATNLQLAHVTAYVVNARGIPGEREDVVVPGESPVADAALRAGGITDTGYAGGSAGGNGFIPFQNSGTGDIVFGAIAGQTGGRVFANRNDLDVLIADALIDGESYYALSYYPANKNWNGAFRQIQVRLRPAKLRARTREGYYANDDANPTQESIDTALALAVRSQVEYLGIPFDATARVSSTSDSLEFKLRVDGHSLSWTSLPNGDLQSELTVVVADVLHNDKVVQSKVVRKQLAVHKTDNGKPDVAPSGPVLLTAEADVPPPASSRIRLVVRDEVSGRIGTWDMPTTSIEGRASSK
jgi:VWFA-related protein